MLGLIRKVSYFAFVCVICFGVVYTAQASKRNLISVNAKHKHAPMRITLGKADLISMPRGVSDVLVANPAVIDVQAIKSDRLYIVGLEIGDTNVIVLDAQGNVLKRFDVHVTYDLDVIQAMITRLFPNEDVQVSSVHDQIVLTGTVSTPVRASKIANLVAHYVSDLQDLDGSIDFLISNLLEVRGEQQVMLQVKIVEAERTIFKELGVNFSANDPNELAVSTLFGTTPFAQTGGGAGINSLGFGAGAGLAASQEPAGVFNSFFNTGIDGIGALGLFISALEEENLINVLAEPNLTAVSGQQAGFLAGGEFPVPTGRDTFGNITIEFREFGVSLNFRPVVLSEDRINLQLNTEVSSLDPSSAVTLADIVVPGLDIRRAETTIEVPSGGSLMIAGLLQSETTKNLTGLPGIKNTPVLGDLISSDDFQRAETELVVIVTCYLVEPYADSRNAERKDSEDQGGELSRIFAANMRRSHGFENAQLFARAGYIVD